MDQSQLARQTLNLLEERLNKLQLLVHGDAGEDEARDTSVSSSAAVRMQSLDRALHKLESESNSIRELLRLNKSQCRMLDTTAEHNIDARDESVAATLVLSYAEQFTSTTIQLRSIQNASIPEASSSAHVIAQTPRIKQALSRADFQNKQMSDLRNHSVELVSRWHQIGVLGLGEVVSEWDERLTDAERSIRQEQARRKRKIEST